MSPSRITALDGLRALAIVAVMVWHYVAIPWSKEHGDVTGLLRLTTLGWSGVDLFFVLSGYLIADILFRAKDSLNYYRVFYLRRVYRLLPLYGLLLLSFFVFYPLYNNRAAQGDLFNMQGYGIAKYLTMTQNYSMAYHDKFEGSWLSATWSLALEWQFYILFAILVRHASRRTVLIVLTAGLVLAPFLRSAVSPMVGYLCLPTRMDSLFVGVLLAHILRDMCLVTWCHKRPYGFTAWVTIFLLGMIVMAYRPSWFGGVNPWYGTFTHTWLALGYGSCIAGLILFPTSLIAKILGTRLFRGLGETAYAAYLIHQPMHSVLFDLVFECETTLNNPFAWAVTALAAVLSFALGRVLYLVVELPCIRLGRKYQYQWPSSITDTPLPGTIRRAAQPQTVAAN